MLAERMEGNETCRKVHGVNMKQDTFDGWRPFIESNRVLT